MRQNLLPQLLIILALTFSITACGGASQPPVGNPNLSTPAATSTPQASVIIIDVPITPGQVRLVLSKSQYAPNEAITVTITNGLSTSIFASANFTDCTLVLLEWKTPTSWVPRGRCPSAQFAGTVELKPGSATPQQLTPVAGVVRPSSTVLHFGVPCMHAWGGKNGCPQTEKILTHQYRLTKCMNHAILLS